MPSNNKALEKLVSDAQEILKVLGAPQGETRRRQEKMAKAFIAVAGLRPGENWSEIKVNDPQHKLRSRDIIRWMNDYLGEDISSGSYDDIRRKDLVYPVEVGVVLRAAGNEDAKTNDGTRGYAINPDFSDLLRSFGTSRFQEKLPDFMKGKTLLVDELNKRRERALIPVNIGDEKIVFSPGEHNAIQKAVIEEFLPRFGSGAEVLYVGDTANKYLYLKEKQLADLHCFEISHDKLPDVLAFSRGKNWLFIIEAVDSANPIDAMRKRTLETLTEKCLADVVFVTAFLSRAAFRKFSSEIAWETEVWIVEEPDHMIHFNGDKFLGPHDH